MKKLRPFPLLALVLLSFFLFSYRLPTSNVFADDFTRDLNDILDISRGKLTLLGPSLSFGGLRSGPYYYYLFAPIFFLTRANVESVLYFNTALFAAALGFFCYEASRKLGYGRSLLATAAVALVPVYLSGARSMSNGFSYLPFLLIFLTLITFRRSFSSFTIFLLGILGGITANFHFVTLPLFFILFTAIFFWLSDKRKFVVFLVGFGLTFLPLVLFEVKHGLVMTKTTLALKDAWLENKNLRGLPDSVQPDKYIPNNFFIVLSQTKNWLGIHPLIIFTIGGLIILASRKKARAGILFVISALAFLLLAVLLRYQFSPHYLVPYSLALCFAFVVLMARSKWWWLLPVIIVLESLSFPKQLYLASDSTPGRFERSVNFAITNDLVSRSVPFNVLRLVNRTNKVTLGFEYRYFFKLKSFEPNSIYEFKSAKTLLIFSDLRQVDLDHLGSWEIDQFGRDYIKGAESYRLGGLTIYKLKK